MIKNNPWYYIINDVLIKKPKPCFVGNQVHVKIYNGCYRVQSVSLKYFTIVKNNEIKNIFWDDFICLKGDGKSEEAILRRELKSLSQSIHLNVSKQLIINTMIINELKNLRYR
jgi:hypothetical protein